MESKNSNQGIKSYHKYYFHVHSQCINNNSNAKNIITFVNSQITWFTNKSITLKPLNNFLETIPFVTTKNIKWYLLKSMDTYKGHLQYCQYQIVIFQDTTTNPSIIPGYEDAPEILDQQTHVILLLPTK